MARTFPLAGLLRLRHAEQDRAAATLTTANDRVREAADARIAARRTLEDSATAMPIEDAATLSAVAAARAATRGMLRELDVVVEHRRTDAERAQGEYSAARRSALGLEKLEEQHTVAARAEELRTEQNALDEIAARSRTEGGTR
ncbi:flagellar FliJ family protein [Microbacterium sp. M1A1_1b]